MRIFSLCAGLFVCLTLILVTAPRANWLFYFGNNDREWSKRIAPTAIVFAAVSKASAPPASADTPHRLLDDHCQGIKAQLQRHLHLHVRLSGHCHRWPPHHHLKVSYLFLQSKYWGSMYLNSGAPGDFDLSGVGSASSSIGSSNEGRGVVPGSKISFGVAANGESNSFVGGWFTGEKNANVALSGGSISDSGRVTENADGSLQLPLTPNWSLTAKLDGGLGPEPQIYAGSGTLQYKW
jgi:hypothetical protein